VAFHNGSTWLPEQLDFSGVNVTSVSTYSNKTAFGFNGVITTYISETTIVSTGSVPVFPIFEFKGPGLLTYVYNETTDQIVQFSGLTLFANETLTIDLTSDNKSISSDVRGDAVARFLVDGGDIDTFSLASGNNTIKVNQATTLTVARIKHTPKYGSIDDGY